MADSISVPVRQKVIPPGIVAHEAALREIRKGIPTGRPGVPVEQHDPDIVAGIAGGPWADQWAQNEEENGRHIGGGNNIMDMAPPPSQEALQWAHGVANKISAANGGASLNDLHEKAVAAGYPHDASQFGFHLGMQHVGHGVGYGDDLPHTAETYQNPLIKIPHGEAYFQMPSEFGQSPDLKNSEKKSDAGRRVRCSNCKQTLEVDKNGKFPKHEIEKGHSCPGSHSFVNHPDLGKTEIRKDEFSPTQVSSPGAWTTRSPILLRKVKKPGIPLATHTSSDWKPGTVLGGPPKSKLAGADLNAAPTAAWQKDEMDSSGGDLQMSERIAKGGNEPQEETNKRLGRAIETADKRGYTGMVSGKGGLFDDPRVQGVQRRWLVGLVQGLRSRAAAKSGLGKASMEPSEPKAPGAKLPGDQKPKAFPDARGPGSGGDIKKSGKLWDPEAKKYKEDRGEKTVGTSIPPHAVTPRIMGEDNVAKFKSKMGVCQKTGDCHKIAGHDSPCSIKKSEPHNGVAFLKSLRQKYAGLQDLKKASTMAVPAAPKVVANPTTKTPVPPKGPKMAAGGGAGPAMKGENDPTKPIPVSHEMSCDSCGKKMSSQEDSFICPSCKTKGRGKEGDTVKAELQKDASAIAHGIGTLADSAGPALAAVAHKIRAALPKKPPKQ